MSSLEVNKIIGAIVATALTIIVVGMIGDVLVDPMSSGGAKRTVVATAKTEPATATAAAPAEPEVPIATLLASADAAKGETVFKKCLACHSTEDGGKNKIGPNLWNIVNADLGAKPDFNYSNALKAKAGKWTYDSLDAFLAKPRDFIKGTKMAFSGIGKASDRAAVIAFLRSLSASPAPLP